MVTFAGGFLFSVVRVVNVPGTLDKTVKLDRSPFTRGIAVSPWHSKCYHLQGHPRYFWGAGVALAGTDSRACSGEGFGNLLPLAAGRSPSPARRKPQRNVCRLRQALKCSLDYFCSRPHELMELLFLALQYNLLTLSVSCAVGTEVPRR